MSLKGKGVYIIENNINKKVYIGSTNVTFEKRFKQHIAQLKKGKHSSIFLQQDFDINGESMFSFKILEDIKTENIQEVRNIERLWINEISPEYNMKHTVHAAISYTDEVSRKMSEGKGCPPFEAYKEDEFIGVFYCQSTCARQLGIRQCNLQRVLVGQFRSIKGFRFKYINEDFRYINKSNKGTKIIRIPKKIANANQLKALEIARNERKLKGIKPIDFSNREIKIKHARSQFKAVLKVYKNKELVGEYLSLIEACEKIEVKSSAITSCLGGRRKSSLGYTFIKEKLTDEQMKRKV